MRPTQFARFLARDGSCFHCGVRDDTLIPGHRIDRGMGGSRHLDVPSAIVTQCSYANGLQTSNADFAADMLRAGIRLSRFPSVDRDPHRLLRSPVYHFGRGAWLLLDDQFGVLELADYLPAPERRYRGSWAA